MTINTRPSKNFPFTKAVLLAGVVIQIWMMFAANLKLSEKGTFGYMTDAYKQILFPSGDASTTMFTVNHSLIHDFTIPWDPNVHRMWLDPNPYQERPPAMVLLTSYGFNQRNQTKGLGISRTIRDREIITGVVNHPWFHPTFWEDFSDNYNQTKNESWLDTTILDSSTRFYVFLDESTCCESNYPRYGNAIANRDGWFNRSTGGIPRHRPFTHLRQRHSIFDHPLFQLMPPDRIKLVLFDCTGWSGWDNELKNEGFVKTAKPMLDRVAAVGLSAMMRQMRPDIDQGMPPPMPQPTHLSQQQIVDIQDTKTCKEEEKRDLFFVYVGNFRSGPSPNFHARGGFKGLHDDERVFVMKASEIHKSKLANLTYQQVNQRAVFSLAARGDNKFSYRFSEVLSAGAIPVLLADEWVLPFRPELVDWNECLLIFPERDAGQTVMDALNNITIEERCRRRQACYNIYQKYMASPEKVINGIIQGLDEVLKSKEPRQRQPAIAEFAGVRCPDNATAAEHAKCNLVR